MDDADLSANHQRVTCHDIRATSDIEDWSSFPLSSTMHHQVYKNFLTMNSMQNKNYCLLKKL